MNTYNRNDVRLYNILLPIWLLIFFPSWLWLILIPANYLIDRIVLRWSLGDMTDKGLFCRKHTWKICLAGFLSDFAGALLMLGIMMLFSGIDGDGSSFLEKAGEGIVVDPFSNILSLIIVAAAIILSGICIYCLDKSILKKAGLEPEQIKRSAVRLAIITAPYVYLLPSKWFYDGGMLSL